MATATSPATVQSKKTKRKKKMCNVKAVFKHTVVLVSRQVLLLTVEINVSMSHW